jgi:hypothetical protein
MHFFEFYCCVSFLCVVLGSSASLPPEYFDAMPETCKVDNWGLPKQSKKTFEGNYNETNQTELRENIPRIPGSPEENRG